MATTTITTLSNIEQSTARTFQRLAALRGISCDASWDDSQKQYKVAGEYVGRSVNGLYNWLNRQPGVKP